MTGLESFAASAGGGAISAYGAYRANKQNIQFQERMSNTAPST